MDDLLNSVMAFFHKFSTLAGAIFMAILARMHSHAAHTRSIDEPFWTWELVFEVMSAFFCGIVAGGVADHFGFGQTATWAAAAVAGHLGPKGLIDLVAHFIPNKK